MTNTEGFARTGVDPVSRCLLGCGAAVAAEGRDEHRAWHAEIARLAIGLERMRSDPRIPGLASEVGELQTRLARVERLLADQSDIATIDVP